jgi:hypothetical protein
MNKDRLIEKSNKLHHIAAKYIVGEIQSLNETSSPKVKLYNELVETCKILKESLENKDINKVSLYLEKKQELSEKFYNMTCIRWRL